MKYISRITILSCTLLTLIVSCTKKELPSEKFYYGNIKGEVKTLPGTPRIELFANDTKVGDLFGGVFGLGPTIEVPAEEPVALQFKRQGTDEVLLDTTVTIPKYQSIYFNLAYSEELGIKGFLENKVVHPDSMVFQVVNNLNEPYNYPDIDLYVVKLDLMTAQIYDTIAIIPAFKKGQLMPQSITVPNFPPDWGSDGTMPAYAAMLKDRETGEFIIHKALGLPPFYMFWEPTYYGKYLICVVRNDGGDYIWTDVITL